MPVPGSECQVWPWRPRPASWRSARTILPGSQPAAARWVESRESKWRIWRSGTARRRRARSIMRAPQTPVSELRSDAQGGALCHRSYELQAETDVHGAGGVGDGAGGDEVGADVGVVADVLEGDTAGEFDLGAAGDFADPIGGFVGGEVVEQQMGSAAFEGLVEFLAGADFDLDGGSAVPGALQRVAHAAGRRDVVVLDQDGIVEAHAVVHHAPCRGGCLFENTKSGGGLAGVEDLAARAFDGSGELGGGGGHTAEALQEVEGDAFAGEQGAGASADGGDDFAIGAAVAILLEDVELIDAAAQLVDFPEQAHARESERLAGQKTAGGHAGFRHAGDAGDIASADVFFEREADDFGHEGWQAEAPAPQWFIVFCRVGLRSRRAWRECYRRPWRALC